MGVRLAVHRRDWDVFLERRNDHITMHDVSRKDMHTLQNRHFHSLDKLKDVE